MVSVDGLVWSSCAYVSTRSSILMNLQVGFVGRAGRQQALSVGPPDFQVRLPPSNQHESPQWQNGLYKGYRPFEGAVWSSMLV